MQYVPTEYLDEVSPPPRDTPDAWIVSLDDGASALDAGLSYDPNEERRVLKDGEIVAFSTFEDHGTTTLRIAADGSWSVDDPMPTGALCVADGDPDTLSDSVEQLVESLREMDGLEEGECELAYYTWDDAPPLRFDAATRRFVEIEAAP